MFTLKMVEALKYVYENIGEVGSLSSPSTLARVTENFMSEPNYTLHRNRRFHGGNYRKTKASLLLFKLQADLPTLDEFQRRLYNPYKYTLLAIRVFSS